ncbi:Hypothetical protein RG540_CH14060 [Neorhizobium galegae bv. orientalis str. HAMBI 540]|uniref:Uncharacterized protein n=1 Tax=Neorhizobium galegae bv. orientalis str. HAMBI 540 TaxID=1028800 RepID=A0A068SP84_NEOGA|nr:Hypothetical protein RG540_CH14060 [Neorhizobium galegae bv. orientalis str. HAMBI 540]
MRYAPTIDLWTLSDEQRAKLPVGQWVTAGPGLDSPRGRFLGAGRQTQVVAWLTNARASRDYRGYMACLRDYARGLANGS